MVGLCTIFTLGRSSPTEKGDDPSAFQTPWLLGKLASTHTSLSLCFTLQVLALREVSLPILQR